MIGKEGDPYATKSWKYFEQDVTWKEGRLETAEKCTKPQCLPSGQYSGKTEEKACKEREIDTDKGAAVAT